MQNYEGCNACDQLQAVFPLTTVVGGGVATGPASGIDYAGGTGILAGVDDVQAAITALNNAVGQQLAFTGPNGSWVRWDGTQFVPYQLSSAATATPTTVLGLNAAGELVQIDPATLKTSSAEFSTLLNAQFGTALETAMASGSQSTTANPMTSILGRDAAGELVQAAVRNLKPTISATGSAAPFTLASGQTQTLVSITVPTTGRWFMRRSYLQNVASVAAEPVAGAAVIKRVYTYLWASISGSAAGYIGDIRSDLPSIKSLTAGYVYGPLNSLGTDGPYDLTAGTVLDMSVTNASTALDSALQYTPALTPTLQLIEMPTTQIEIV